MVKIKALKEANLSLTEFKGLHINQNSAIIPDNSSPDMMNFLLDDRGVLDKNLGYTALFESLGTGQINGLYEYKKASGSIYLVHYATNLYSLNLTTGVATQIYTSMANHSSTGFTFDDKFYILDGTAYRTYDGTNVTLVSSNAYIPTILIGTPPAGGGTIYEQVNLLTPAFKQSFAGDGSSVAYQLSLIGLDATEVIAVVNGVTLEEDTGFTVNRTTGVVTFSVAPTDSEIDNVIITAYKTVSGNADQINKCTFSVVYGGSTDTRVWFSGNSTYKNIDFKSGLLDPTYFPELGYTEIGLDSEAIVGYAKQYSSLVIFKERSMYLRELSISSDGSISFPLKRLNDKVGAVSTSTIQLLENNPTFLDYNGVYYLTGTNIDSERNVKHISDNIDRNIDTVGLAGLLETSYLDKYISVDFDAKYWLINSITGLGFVYDYRFNEWFTIDTHYMSTVAIFNNQLYFGDSRKGVVYKRNLLTDSNPYNYDGIAINAYWRSKVFNLGTSEYIKRVNKVFFSIKPNLRTSCTLAIRSDKKSEWTDKKTIRIDLFSYSGIIYSLWTYGANIFPKATTKRVKSKKVMYFQMELSNDVLNESLGILNTSMTFVYQKQIRR